MNSLTDDEAVAIAGAIRGYLGHNKYKILKISEITEKNISEPEAKSANNSFLSFLGFSKPKK